MVLTDVGTVLALAFVAYARSHDFAQTIEVVAFQAQAVLNFLTHILCPWLGAESTNAKLDHVFRNAHFLHRFGQIKGVGRGAGDACDAKVADQLRMLLGVTRGSWNHRGPNHLNAVMRTETTGEQAIAIAYGERVVAAHTIGGQTLQMPMSFRV